MPVEDGQCAEGSWDPNSGLMAFQRLYSKYKKMDAIFVANDQMALAVLNTAWDKGIRIPEDLGVAGFDDISESAYFIPPLTTVRQDFRKLGALAVRKILALKGRYPDASKKTDHTTIPPELIIRQSTQRT